MNAPLMSDAERVNLLQEYVASGADDLDMVTRLLGKVIESGAWREFTTPNGFPVRHRTFHDFVTADRWDGLGTSRDALVGWVREQDPDVASAVERAWRDEVPAALKSAGRPSGNGSATTNNGQSITGKTADGILARLKRDDPDMAQKVINGEITANAAARQKGWRKPRVLLTSPSSVATRLRDHFTADETAEIRRHLMPDYHVEVNISDPTSMAAALKEHLTADEIKQIKELL